MFSRTGICLTLLVMLSTTNYTLKEGKVFITISQNE